MYAIRNYYDQREDEDAGGEDAEHGADGVEALDRGHGVGLGITGEAPGPDRTADKVHRACQFRQDVPQDDTVRITSYNVCYTKLLRLIVWLYVRRRTAAREAQALAARCDAMIVIGDAKSPNTRRLVVV